MTEETTSTCEECGASIYQEHLEAGKAVFVAGKLMCPHCVKEHHDLHAVGSAEASDDLLEPIAVDAEKEGSMSGSRIQAFGDDVLGGGKWDDSKYKRPLEPDKPGGTRCRIFHSKLNDGAIAFMSEQINDWLDASAGIYVKTSTSTIGVFEGKHADPNLIVTLFY